MIYAQRYLREQGLAVTYDNPDIQLFKSGVPISSSELDADTDYDVVATIYNNSVDAPAVGLNVEFAFLSFGIGAAQTDIGTATVNVPVKGAPGHPARAQIMWHTPITPGHYCLRVEFAWEDDANPKNNLGFENTRVGPAASPVEFEIPLRNDDTIRKHIRMSADGYSIPPRMECGERPTRDETRRKLSAFDRRDVFIPPTEEDADWLLARARHGVEAHPVPPDWRLLIDPMEVTLAPNEERIVHVSIDPPGSFAGKRSFNVNAMHGSRILGGVTLTVTR